MSKTNVVALEGSRRAIPAATELSLRDNARVVTVHLVERTRRKRGGDVHADEAQIQAAIPRHAKELSEPGIEGSDQLRDAMVGGPAKSIAEIAEDEGAGRIVIGTPDHSELPAIMRGSVS